jgi:hypothetical protein
MNNIETIPLLASCYMPTIQYFTKIVNAESLLIEHFEHFQKQTYRNRCNIYSANGILNLTVPIESGMGKRLKTKEVKISYNDNWQKVHWKSIQSSYRCSPFFEYYEDSLVTFYEKKYELLIDYNAEIFATLLKMLKLKLAVNHTTEYTHYEFPVVDYRNAFLPKDRVNFVDAAFEPQPYTQVFGNKYGFMPNLSILDLLCNEGTASAAYLASCITGV